MARLKWHKYRGLWKKFNRERGDRARRVHAGFIVYDHNARVSAIDQRIAEHIRSLPPEEVIARLKARKKELA